jgi:glycosyltransferase involved in cell wall biosynthesis
LERTISILNAMNVLQLGKFYPLKGGVEKVMYSLTTGLSQHEVNCDMMCASADGKHGTRRLNDNARLICCRSMGKVKATMISPEMIWKLRKVCGNYDIIHIHYPDPMAALALFLSGYNGQVIVHWHSDILKQRQLLKLLMPLQRWLLHRAQMVIGTTPVYLRQSPYLRHVQEKTECLPIGINRLSPSAEGVERIRRRCNGRKIIFSIGRLVAYKGFKYLIDAARYLDDSYVVLIGGDGPLREKLQTQIVDERLMDKVHLLGRVPQDEIADYFGTCELYCLSSIHRTEAFAIVQVEAMSCGKPVVATTISGSGVPWVNKSGYSGLNVQPCSSRELARAIKYVCENPDIYNRFSRQARCRFEQHFQFHDMINNCIKLYKKVSNEKTKNGACDVIGNENLQTSI